MPITCNICKLVLASPPHLTRSYHHLYPTPSYTILNGLYNNNININRNPNTELNYCYSCYKQLNPIDSVECTKCKKAFCSDCDVFIHSVLFLCPGCDNIK